jgi:Domain of unknown function (DUF6969)
MTCLHPKAPAPAVERLTRLLQALEKEGTSVMALVRNGQPAEPCRLYPGEYGVFDRGMRAQFYYHAHAGVEHEAGHFHTVRLFRDHVVHLVAISMGHDGWPQELFTVNLWAVGDPDTPPAVLKRYVRAFHVGPTRGDARLIGFVNLVFLAFRPEIEALQDAKARAIAQYRHANAGRDPFDDRSVEVLSRVAIDVRPGRCRPRTSHAGVS